MIKKASVENTFLTVNPHSDAATTQIATLPMNINENVNFEGFYWELITSWKNDGAGDGKFTASYTSELKVTKGSENTLNASMGMLFEGLSVGIDASSKTFQQTETTTSETHTVELAYGPGADDRSPLSKGLLVQDEYLVHE
ncbi:uncharacterized protein AtWU_06617 [Aspergillus tubingensis]|uniref:uncharacterized protein n=1 Tax=Aspergillus tubingensis TaxID=5068 RepID=UPI00157A11A4|nr:uncharacterized protein AtWU_06617 [Aspergillus tubingensis]GFN16815.1 hypothetical protein AtWU_06617 [Aspergillus tubingensis]